MQITKILKANSLEELEKKLEDFTRTTDLEKIEVLTLGGITIFAHKGEPCLTLPITISKKKIQPPLQPHQRQRLTSEKKESNKC